MVWGISWWSHFLHIYVSLYRCPLASICCLLVQWTACTQVVLMLYAIAEDICRWSTGPLVRNLYKNCTELVLLVLTEIVSLGYKRAISGLLSLMKREALGRIRMLPAWGFLGVVTMLVLSLFPGIGLLDSAFEAEGFCVVRGPDVLWGGDVRQFHPLAGRFDGIIGGPPCQSFSSLVHLVRANGDEPRFGNLIPEFERCVAEAQPAWFLMENVRAAPEPVVAGYGVKSFFLDNSQVLGEDGFGQEQMRLRKFCFGMRGVESPPNLLNWIDLATFLLPEASAVISSPVGLDGDGCQHSKEGRERAKVKAAKTLRQSVLSSNEAVPVKIGGSGKPKKTLHEAVTGGHDKPPSKRIGNGKAGYLSGSVTSSDGGASVRMRRYKLSDACRLQGLPEDFLADAPFTAEGKLKAVANGVPIPMGRAVAKAIKEALHAGAMPKVSQGE